MYGINRRVVGACIVGAALLITAYIFAEWQSKSNRIPLSNDARKGVVVASAPTREYIPTTDTNNDGVPDWQDMLVVSEPLSLATSSVTYDAPETLTDQFAVEFFQTYVRDKGYGDFGSSPDELIATASTDLQSQAQDTFYKISDIIPLATDNQENWKEFGNHVATEALAHAIPADTRNEITILEDAVSTQNPDVLSELAPIKTSYQDMRDHMLEVPVPPGLVKEHLDYINALNAILSDIKAMELAFSDPLFSLLRLQRYQDDTLGLYNSLLNLQRKIKSAGVVYGPNEPAGRFVIE